MSKNRKICDAVCAAVVVAARTTKHKSNWKPIYCGGGGGDGGCCPQKCSISIYKGLTFKLTLDRSRPNIWWWKKGYAGFWWTVCERQLVSSSGLLLAVGCCCCYYYYRFSCSKYLFIDINVSNWF